MMKIVFNFKFIYMDALMHVACYFFLIISLIIYIFIIKIVFKFKCIHAFAWVTCVYVYYTWNWISNSLLDNKRVYKFSEQ